MNIVIAKERQRLRQSRLRDRHTLLSKVRDDKNRQRQENSPPTATDAQPSGAGQTGIKRSYVRVKRVYGLACLADACRDAGGRTQEAKAGNPKGCASAAPRHPGVAAFVYPCTAERMVLVTLAGTKVTRVCADARIKIKHREAIRLKKTRWNKNLTSRAWHQSPDWPAHRPSRFPDAPSVP